MHLAKTYHILGDGLAGLMLADRLLQSGHSAVVYGNGRTNTPPVGMVQLFAGRSFRRSQLEILAFERAIPFWSAEPLAVELPIRRKIEPGGRLHRSLAGHGVPDRLAPRRLDDCWVEYGPGFAVLAQQLESRLRSRVLVREGEFQPADLPCPRILALGLRAPEWLSSVAWDLSRGRVLQAPDLKAREAIILGHGIHLIPTPDQGSVSLGGLPLKADPFCEVLERAYRLTGRRYQAEARWEGGRCTPARDRRPLLGWSDPETFLFLGFGSRALFWLPHCLDLAVAALDGAEIPEPLWAGRSL